MLSYQYVAKDPATGRQVKAEVQADSEKSAAKLIKAEGLTPIEIYVGKKSGLASIGGGPKFLNKVHTKDKVLFSRQLSTLINAGLPLVQSLRNVNNQTTSKPFKIIISQIINDVESGSTLSDSMGRHPDVFNQVYLSLVAAGETSGTLDQALERLANQQEKDADIISKVRGAMVYPLIVLLVMGGVVTFMMVKVLPQVQTLYESLPGTRLPFVTVALLAVSHFITHFWWVVLILFIAGGLFTTRWARSITGKRAIDKLKMRSWPVSNLYMKMYMARFCRTGTTLISSGVPLIQTLEITSRAISNVYIEDSLRGAVDKVKGGKSLGDALTGDPNFLELVPNMLKIGEQSGSMEQMLGKAADYYEKELDNEIKAIQTIIEPVMMILMGLIAFVIVAAILLPIYNLASQSGNIVN